MYWHERITREAFLIKNNQKVWLYEVGKYAQMSIISCALEKGELRLDINECNDYSKKEFEIRDQDSLKNFLYKTILNMHILINKPINDNFDEKNMIQYESKLFTNFRLNVGSQMKTVLVQLRSIFKKKNLNSSNYPIMSIAYDALRSNYNLQLYLNPIIKLNISSFLLEPLIKNVQSIVRQREPDLLNLDISCVTDSHLLIYSCQKTVFHIILNLLSMIVEQTQQLGNIRIQAKQTSSQIGSFINFIITTEIASFDLPLQGQNYPTQQKILTTKQQVINDVMSTAIKKKGQIGLEMIVSEYLIGKIGPQRSIKLTDGQLCFTIFQDLKVLLE